MSDDHVNPRKIGVAKSAFNTHDRDRRESLFEKELKAIDGQIETLLSRIVDATSERVIGACETRIDALEREKLILNEKIAQKAKSRRSLGEVFELTLDFFKKLENLLKRERLEDK